MSKHGRVIDAFESTKYAGTIAGVKVMDLSKGGVNGNIPILGEINSSGANAEAWIRNHSYVGQNVIAVVLTTPLFFEYMDSPELWRKTWKALFEVHPKSITGFNSGLTVETAEEELGGIGEMQEVVTDTKKARTNLSVVYKEKMHKSIQKYLDSYIRYGIKDYVTKKPLVVDVIPSLDDIGGGYTPDMWSGTTLFIEPDVTRKGVVDAWLSTQIFFKDNGERTAKRELAAGGEELELSLSLASITMTTEKVFELADAMLSQLTTISTLSSDMELPSSGINENLK